VSFAEVIKLVCTENISGHSSLFYTVDTKLNTVSLNDEFARDVYIDKDKIIFTFDYMQGKNSFVMSINRMTGYMHAKSGDGTPISSVHLCELAKSKF
jgi:hypothetical protein